jgi:CRP-like cAMP-binding protein
MRLKKNAKIDLLAAVPLFAECSKAELSEVAAIGDELDLPAGAALIREGERGREFLVVVDGTVEVTRDGRTVNELGAGSWVGEIALIADVPRTATVVATSPVRLLVITDRAFQQLIRKTPSIASKVLQSVGERLHETESSRATQG